MRQLHKVLTVGEREIVVRELTVSELRQWIAEAGDKEQPFDLLGEKLRGVPLSLLARMCGLTPPDLEAVAPFPESDLAPIEAAARECNPSFFGVLGLAKAAQG